MPLADRALPPTPRRARRRPVTSRRPRAAPDQSWAFLTNHALVLTCLAADPAPRLRDVAGRVGISERRVWGIVAELAAAGYLTAVRAGHRNRHTIHRKRPLREPLDPAGTVGALVDLGAPEGG